MSVVALLLFVFNSWFDPETANTIMFYDYRGIIRYNQFGSEYILMIRFIPSHR